MFAEKKSLAEILEETDPKQIDIMAEFLTSVAELHEKVVEATDIDTVMGLTAQAMVDPIINSSYLAENPGECLYTMLNLNAGVVKGELETRIFQSGMSEEEKNAAYDDIDELTLQTEEKLLELLTDRSEDISSSGVDRDLIVSNWLSDVAKQIETKPETNETKDKDGFFSTLKSMKKYYKGQADIFVSMKKNVKTSNDVAVWYSRYLLVPAIANAKEGHLFNLEVICGLSNKAISDDCSNLAKELGLEIDKKFDPLKLRLSIQQLCKARTGFFNPESFLYSLKPDALVMP